MPRQFTKQAGPKPPCTIKTELFDKVIRGIITLTRKEKDQIADYCYGISGSGFPGMKQAGWLWSVSAYLQEYIVDSRYGSLQSYHTPDKTSLRLVLNSRGVYPDRIIKVTKEN